MAPKVSLTIDLYRPIFDEVTTLRDLAILARVSRTAQRDAEKVLYQSVTVGSPDEVVVFCKRVCSVARFGPYIRSFVADFDLRYPTLVLRSFFTVWAAALRKMSGLLHLAMPTSTWLGFPHARSCAQMFHGCTFQLQTLKTFYLFDDQFLSFISTQPNLRLLQFLREDPNLSFTIPDDVVPHLRVLNVDYSSQVGFQFFRTRPITHMRILDIASGRVDRSHTPPMPTLKALKIRTIDADPILETLPDLVPELELLSGIGIGYHGNALPASLNLLSALTKLRVADMVLDFNPLQLPKRLTIQEDMKDFLALLSHSCPTIHLVRIKGAKGWGDAITLTWRKEMDDVWDVADINPTLELWQRSVDELPL